MPRRQKEYVYGLVLCAIFGLCPPAFSADCNPEDLAAVSGPQSHRPPLELDFLTDAAHAMLGDLAQKGIKKPFTTVADAAYASIAMWFRHPPEKKYKVVTSKKFDAKKLTLTLSLRSGIDLLIRDARRGNSLLPRMSRSIADSDYQDAMFNDWRVFHFHLGEKIPTGDKFVTRTNELAFGYVEGDTLYLIDIAPHTGSFTNPDLLETLHAEFPAAIEKFSLGSEYTFTNAEMTQDPKTIGLMRKYGLNMTYVMRDGTGYIQPGGGLSAARTSIEVTRKVNDLVHWLRSTEHWFRENEDYWRQQLEDKGGRLAPGIPLQFKLVGYQLYQYLIVEERTTGQRLTIPMRRE